MKGDVMSKLHNLFYEQTFLRYAELARRDGVGDVVVGVQVHVHVGQPGDEPSPAAVDSPRAARASASNSSELPPWT